MRNNKILIFILLSLSSILYWNNEVFATVRNCDADWVTCNSDLEVWWIRDNLKKAEIDYFVRVGVDYTLAGLNAVRKPYSDCIHCDSENYDYDHHSIDIIEFTSTSVRIHCWNDNVRNDLTIPHPTCTLSYSPSSVIVGGTMNWTLTSTNAVSAKSWCATHWQAITLSSTCGSWPCQTSGTWSINTSTVKHMDCKTEVTNSAGTATCSSSYQVTDNTPPTVSYTLWTYTNNTWTQSNVTATIFCYDGWSWCDSNTYQYRESTTFFTCNSGWTWTNWSSKAYTTDWIRYICFRAKDNAWNGPSYSGVATAKIDKTAPIVTDNYTFDNVWTNWASKTITLSPSDWLSWIKETRWCESTTTCTPTTVWTSITKNANYNNTIWYQTWDNTNNASTIWTVIVKLDKTPPIASAINSSTTWKKTDISIPLSASDLGWSGLLTAKYRWDNTDCSVGTPYNNGDSLLLNTEWTHTLYLCVTDRAWNSWTWNGTYKLDKTLPTWGSLTYFNWWTNTAKDISYGWFTDAGWSKFNRVILQESVADVIDNNGNLWTWSVFTTVDQIPANIDNNDSGTDTYTRTFVNRKAYKYQVIAYDNADNSKTIVWTNIIKMESEKSTVWNLTYDDKWTNNTSQTVTFTINDTGWSKLKKYTLQRSISTNNPDFTSWWIWWDIKTVDNINANTKTDSYWYTGENNKAYKFQIIIEDYAWNTYTYTSPNITKIDTTIPAVSDIINLIQPNHLATISKNFNFTVWVNWWSPITHIGAFFEKYDSNDIFSWAQVSNSWSWSFYENIRNVDSQRASNWWRQYSLRVSKICDEAWNCIWSDNSTSDLITYPYYVYANPTTTWGSSIYGVTRNELDDNINIADWSSKNLTITLRDAYGNAVVPATWITRNIGFNWDVYNSMYLNQHTRSWSNSVFVDRTGIESWIYNNRLNTSVSFNNETSTGWLYNYKFRIYTPTSNQNNWPKSDTNANFNIKSITYNVADTIWWTMSGQSLSGAIKTITSKFSPIYYTTISWQIKDNWLKEWNLQTSYIKVNQSWSILPTGNLYIEFGSWNTNASTDKLNMKFWTWTNLPTVPVWEWNWQRTSFKDSFVSDLYTINTKLTKTSIGSINDIQSSYFSTHIKYDLDWKEVIYNSDVYNKTSYWWTIWTGWTYASAVKIIWQTYSKNYDEILTGQSGIDVKILNWSMTKSSLKTEIKRNAYNLVKNITTNNWTKKITNSNFSSNADWIKLLSWSMIYFGWLNWDNVTLNSLTFDWNKTILIEWWNLYIKWNIDLSNNKSMLSIVVLKDSNWKGWNIYIDSGVSYIKATMYADKSLISYDGTNELDWNTSFSVLQNQLYIYGSVFSENTIWWSRSDPLKCPYYVKTTCTMEEAQKYDLNYLRSYYIQDTNNNLIIDSGDFPAWWGSSYFNSTSPNYKYPVVIEYNPLIQTNPSILFRK